MTTLEILFILGALGAAPALLILALRGAVQESWVLAALLAAGFFALSVFPILETGYLGFVPYLSQGLWGTQVWYDLVIAVVVSLTFIVPRAKAAGMRVLPWTLAVASTGSIAMLPMLARLFWLEKQARTA